MSEIMVVETLEAGVVTATDNHVVMGDLVEIQIVSMEPVDISLGVVNTTETQIVASEQNEIHIVAVGQQGPPGRDGVATGNVDGGTFN